MTFPVWGGFNTGYLNDTEINGAAPSPYLEFDGFEADIVPVLIGGVAGLHAYVMHARADQRNHDMRAEAKNIEVFAENTDINALPENRAMGKERSRKDFP